MEIAYLNGEYLPLKNATISVFDRGFLFGDGVYEVVPICEGHCFRLEQHLQRLARSLQQIHIAIDDHEHPLAHIARELLKKNNVNTPPTNQRQNQSQNPQQAHMVYLQVTRGVAAHRSHAFPSQTKPTVFACVMTVPVLTNTEKQQGIRAITVEDQRWHRCDIKSISLLANVLAKQSAIDAKVKDAIFIRDGFALEGSASNLFIVHSHKMITPPLSSFMLGGITRDFVIECAHRYRKPIEEKPISKEALFNADEIWLTSSTQDIMPVVGVDQQKIGNGRAGPIWQEMNTLFQQEKQKVIHKA